MRSLLAHSVVIVLGIGTIICVTAFSPVRKSFGSCQRLSNLWLNENSGKSADIVCIPGSDPNRPQKVNQDAYFVVEEIADSITCVGVMDGHGLKGHVLNEYLSKQLPLRIQEQLEKLTPNVEIEEQMQRLAKFDLDLHADSSTMKNEKHAALVNAFHHAHWDAINNEKVPAGRSGSTCVVCLVEPSEITIAHVGDSRAILVDKESGSVITQLSKETTAANFDSERKRIENCEGRIDDRGNIFYGPVGIAMTRSLGNAVMMRAGVVPTPMVTTFARPAQDSVLVLATDGIWEVLSNEVVANTFSEHTENPSQAIAEAARKKWIGDLPIIEEKIDDITIVILPL